MLDLVFLGPPGAGKGTQAKRFAERFRISHISTGDLLRKAVDCGSRLGREAKEYMDRGELAPDELVMALIEQQLEGRSAEKGAVFDGFPRTKAQAEALSELLKQHERSIDLVLFFKVDSEELTRRLSGRRVCGECGALYHIDSNPPQRGSRCDHCGGEVIQRDDDREEVVRSRLKVYDEQTAPLIDFYRSQSLLRPVDGEGTVDEIAARVVEAVSRQ